MAEGTAFAFPAVERANPLLTAHPAAPNQCPPDPSPQNVVIAIHCPRDEKTAVYKSSLRWAGYLEAQGHTCRIATPDDFPALRRTSARLFPLVYPVLLALWLAKQSDVDVVLFHSYAGWATTLLQKYLGGLRKLRVGIVFHGLEPIYYPRLKQQTDASGHKLSLRYRLLHGFVIQKLLRLSTRAAGAVFCLNGEERHYLVDHGWAAPQRVGQVANSVSESFFIERTQRDEPSVLLFVGQWLPMKGTRYLVEAFTELCRKHRDLRLCCAGTMLSETDVRNSFPAEVRERVSVYPRISEQELLALHYQADVFVFPSLSEGFSLALAEAMASGLPIVATAVGAAPDLLVNNQSALLVPPHERNLLTHAISECLEDGALRVRLGTAAQAAAEQLRPGKVVKDFEVCFQLLVPDRKPGDNGWQHRVSTSEGI